MLGISLNTKQASMPSGDKLFQYNSINDGNSVYGGVSKRSRGEIVRLVIPETSGGELH